MFTKKNMIWLLFMLIFSIGCLELFGNIYLTKILHKSTRQKFRFNSYRIYEHVPGFKEGDGKRNWIEINNQGFRRITEIQKIKPQNTYRIFLLGGSAAHGISSAAPYPIVHIYPDETMDAYLEKMLKKTHKGINFEVINAAVTGYKTFQHTAYILSELLDYEPDMILFFDGANDHFVQNPAFNAYLHNGYQFWNDRLQYPSFGGCLDYFMLWASKISAFARGYLSWKMKKDASAPEKSALIYKNERDTSASIASHKITAKKTFLRSIETNISILKNNNIQCIITLQPMLVLRNESLLSSQEKGWRNYKKDEDITLLYPIVIDELTSLTQKYKVPFIDINSAFNKTKDNGRQLFIDYCHLSSVGGKVAAERIFPVIDSVYVNSFKK